MESYPVKAVVIAKEKRHDPVKHYVFIVEVKWSDNSRIPICRQYSDFTHLHTELSDFINSTPEYKKKYQLPHFPVKKVFQRNEISKNASVRRHAFDDYCQHLLKMDKVISQHQQVISFFKARECDINPLTQSQTKPGKNRTSLLQALAELVPGSKKLSKNIRQSRSSGDLSDVLEEDDPIYVSSPIVCESYRALADYSPQGKGEIKLKEGQLVEVVEKYANGWWFIQTEYGFGWTPATYLTQVTEKKEEEEEPEPVYSGHQYITTKAYKAEHDDELTFDKGVLVKVLHKLMDGWWIISYQEEVGYAPATYLVSFLNPHLRDSRYGQMQNRKPTKRRRTIKNASGKLLKDVKQRDLSMYKKMNAKLEEIKRKRKEAALEKSVTDTENTKVQEYEYVDEDEMEQVKNWAETQRRSSVSSTSSIIGPPLPPRPSSMSSPFDVVFDINNRPANASTSPRRHSCAGSSGLVFVADPGHHSNTIGPGTKLFNKAPPSPRATRRQMLSAFEGAEGSAGERCKNSIKARISVPNILITGCEESTIETLQMDDGGAATDSSSEEETVESLYATGKEVKPSIIHQKDHGSKVESGKRVGDEAGSKDSYENVFEVDDTGCRDTKNDVNDSLSDEEETVESLYSNNKDVRSIKKTKVKFSEVQKSIEQDVEEYMNMSGCSYCSDDDEISAYNVGEKQIENIVDTVEEAGQNQEDLKQGTAVGGASGEGNSKQSMANVGQVSKGQNAMDTLIESLKRKSIGGVYTNDKGELCIQFEKE